MKKLKKINLLITIVYVLLSITLFGLGVVATLTFNVEKTLKNSKVFPNTTIDSIKTVLIKFKCNEELVEPYATRIYYSCSNFKVEWTWIVAKIVIESRFNPTAKSFIATKLNGDKEQEYAIGLLQIKPSTAYGIADELGDEYSDKMIYDGLTNIRWGTYYFSKKLLRYRNNYEKAIRAYTLGDRGYKENPSASDKHWNKVDSVHTLIKDNIYAN